MREIQDAIDCGSAATWLSVLTAILAAIQAIVLAVVAAWARRFYSSSKTTTTRSSSSSGPSQFDEYEDPRHPRRAP